MTEQAKAALQDGIAEAEYVIGRMSRRLERMERKGIAGAGELRELLRKLDAFVELTGDLVIADTIRKNTAIAGAERAQEVAENMGIPGGFLNDE